jgi:hypothetical protein
MSDHELRTTLRQVIQELDAERSEPTNTTRRALLVGGIGALVGSALGLGGCPAPVYAGPRTPTRRNEEPRRADPPPRGQPPAKKRTAPEPSQPKRPRKPGARPLYGVR